MNKKVLIAVIVVLVLVLGGLFVWKGDTLMGRMKMTTSKSMYQECLKYDTWWKNGVFTDEASKIFKSVGGYWDKFYACQDAYGIPVLYTYDDCLKFKSWFTHNVFTSEMNKLGLDGENAVSVCYNAYGLNPGAK